MGWLCELTIPIARRLKRKCLPCDPSHATLEGCDQEARICQTLDTIARWIVDWD